MARGKKRDEHQDEGNGKRGRAAPEGFKAASAARDAYWARFTKDDAGEVTGYFRGELIGRFSFDKPDPRTGKKRVYYQIRTLAADPESQGIKTGSEEPQTIPAGSIVNIDEKKALECLASLAADGKRHEVIIEAIDKLSLPDGGDFWDIDVKHRVMGDDESPLPF